MAMRETQAPRVKTTGVSRRKASRARRGKGRMLAMTNVFCNSYFLAVRQGRARSHAAARDAVTIHDQDSPSEVK